MASPTTDYLGLRLLRAMLHEKDLDTLVDLGFDVDWIIDGTARTAFTWITDYVAKSATWPAVASVETECDVSLPDDVEDVKYLVEVIRKRHLSYHLTDALKDVARKVDSKDPDGALASLLSYVTASTAKLTITKALSFKETGPHRLTEYATTKALPDGISTPWEKLNRATLGWVNGTLNVLMAMPNVGKTWMSCILANHAYVQGKKVLLVTMEMPSERIARRLDALRYQIPFGALRNKMLMPEDEKAWELGVKEDLTNVGDIIVADKRQVRKVVDVVTLHNYYKPDLVIVDGGYRFEGRGKSQWEGTLSVVNDLQLYAESTGVPWVVTTQYGDANETGKVVRTKGAPKMTMWGVRYGKEWVSNPDVVIGLHQEPEDREFKKLRLYLLKTRDVDESSMFQEMMINWRLNEMDFSEVGAAPTTVTGTTIPPSGSSTPPEILVEF